MGDRGRYSAGNAADLEKQRPTGSSLLVAERTGAGTGPDANRHVGCARLWDETVKTPTRRKRRRDLDLSMDTGGVNQPNNSLFGRGYQIKEGIRNRVATRRQGGPISTSSGIEYVEKDRRNQSHTFRVDSCSKHLLAAPLNVQNVDAWKSNGN